MKKTMIAKGIVVACMGIVTLIGYTAAACAQDLTDEETAYTQRANDIENTAAIMDEGNGPGLGVALLGGVATAAPYLTAPAAVLVNATVGTIAGIFLPEDEEKNETNPAVQIAANEER